MTREEAIYEAAAALASARANQAARTPREAAEAAWRGMGYHRAGFCVTGVDINPQPRYPFHHVVGDALEVFAAWGSAYAARHASPPCQSSSALTKGNRRRDGWTDTHVDLIPATRTVLERHSGPTVIENVQGSSLRRDLTLCGEMFGLAVIRHRYFELDGWSMAPPAHRPHRGRVAGMRHGKWFTGPYFAVYGDGGGKGTVAQWQQAMGIEWTADRRELAEAIPPAYTELIGSALLKVVSAEAVAA